MIRYFALAIALVIPVNAAPVPKDNVKIDAETKKSIDKALDWLRDNQERNGSWGNSAITSFALLAFMSNGHVPGQGKYGPEVAKGIRHLVAGAREDGYLVGERGGNMYCHGMAALALSQAWGMTGDEEIKKVLKRSIELIIKSQNHEGGWRYEPQPTGADISVTIMQVMALRGAKDGGIHVPDETIKKAIAYINKCYDPKTGGYRYQPGSSGAGFARTAAGVCVLQLAGKYDAKEIADAIKYMESVRDDNQQHWWYGNYYAIHAFHQIGGEKWEKFYKDMKTKLLAKQQANGSWRDNREAQVGPVYQTAIAVIMLSVPSHYLPIYQR